jgi:hypothetical protein
MDQYRSWPFRTAMERNNDDRRANAGESGAVFRFHSPAGKQIFNDFILADYQTVEPNEHNE